MLWLRRRSQYGVPLAALFLRVEASTLSITMLRATLAREFPDAKLSDKQNIQTNLLRIYQKIVEVGHRADLYHWQNGRQFEYLLGTLLTVGRYPANQVFLLPVKQVSIEGHLQ